MTFLGNLDWRFATKKFDSEKLLEPEKLDNILESIRKAPTSFGLQPFRVWVIEDKEIKKKMRRFSFMQSQVADASHILVFATRTDVFDRIDQYIDLAVRASGKSKIALQPIKMAMKGAMASKNAQEKRFWATNQVYIALGFALGAASELEVDSCPLEGFSSKKMDQLLDLPEYHTSVVMLALGYRAKGPKHPKTRFPREDLFVE